VRLFHALPHYKPCQTLEHILIVFNRPGIQELAGGSLMVVAQLLCFTQLRLLLLNFYHSIILDKDILFGVILSWPHIRSLTLKDTGHGTVTFRRSFSVLC
jgi:hypothetical protein